MVRMCMRVLIADSDVTTLELMTAVFACNGFCVVSTNDGGDALARFFEGTFELVVCDADLPGLTGFQLCRTIRTHNSTVRMVVYGNPSWIEQQENSSCADLGCDAVLERPFRFGPIKKLLSDWGLVPAKKSEQAQSTNEDVPSFTIPPPPLLDAANLEAAPSHLEKRPTPDLEQASNTALPIPIPVEDDLGVDKIERDEESSSGNQETLPQGTSTLPPSVSRYGDLSSVPLPRLLFELHLGTYTGKVVLSRKGAKRVLHLRAGFPVCVQSDQLQETLGVLLKESGRVTEEQMEQGKAHSMEQKLALGTALVEMGILRERDLLDALMQQTEEKLIHTFAWREGTYSIEDDSVLPEGALPHEVSVLGVIWRGVREHYDLVSLLSYFEKMKKRFIVTTDIFASQEQFLSSHLKDLDLYALLKGNITFEQALLSNDTRCTEIAQALYVLLVTDMIRSSVDKGTSPGTQKQRPKATSQVTPVDYRHIMDTADGIACQYMLSANQNHFELLEIDIQANENEIQKAYQKENDRLQHALRLPGLPHEAQKRCRSLMERLSEARDVLSDPKTRATYVQVFSKGDKISNTQNPGATPQEKKNAEQSPFKETAEHKRECMFKAEQAYKEGLHLLELLDAEGARGQFEIALQHHANEPTYLVGMAQAWRLEHRKSPKKAFQTAFEFLEKALSVDSSHVLANVEAAKLLLAQKEHTKARQHIERVLQRAPHHQLAKRLLQEVEEAGEHEANKNNDNGGTAKAD